MLCTVEQEVFSTKSTLWDQVDSSHIQFFFFKQQNTFCKTTTQTVGSCLFLSCHLCLFSSKKTKVLIFFFLCFFSLQPKPPWEAGKFLNVSLSQTQFTFLLVILHLILLVRKLVGTLCHSLNVRILTLYTYQYLFYFQMHKLPVAN